MTYREYQLLREIREDVAQLRRTNAVLTRIANKLDAISKQLEERKDDERGRDDGDDYVIAGR